MDNGYISNNTEYKKSIFVVEIKVFCILTSFHEVIIPLQGGG